MKHFNRWSAFTLLMVGLTSFSFAQQQKDALGLGSTSAFKNALKQKLTNTGARTSQNVLTIATPDNSNLGLNVKYQDQKNGGLMLVGEVSNSANSSFFIQFTEKGLHGNIVLQDQKKAYEYKEENGTAFIIEKDINKVMCVEYAGITPLKSTEAARTSDLETAEGAYDLQSLPGAEAVVLLDFDGYQLPAGTGWLNGNAWYAPASGMSDAKITEAWEVIAEDYRPYDVNITTSQAVYNSYPVGRRVRCVFTPSNDPAPGAGGVAFVGGFGYNDWPCWVFIMDGKTGGEAASHEIGHTVGLGHDGRTNPDEGYFLGHGDWAPIMGAGYYKPISQWSRGEYAYANNQEDDLNVMTQHINRRGDDHGNNFGSSTFINKDGAGNISLQYGVISTTGDVDMFRFTCGTGNVSLDINTVERHGDLDILVRLYEGASGNQIGTFNGSGLNTHLDAYLDAGTYYIGVDGTGAGDPATNGYSDYASLGSFWISGVVPAGGGDGGGSAAATFYQDCNYGGYAVGLAEGSYNLSDLNARGIVNDDISSLKVAAGYKVTMYWDSNFSGNTLVKTGDDNCLVDDGWNDQATSLVIARDGSSTVIEAENFTSMSGVENESCTEGGSNVAYIDTGDWMAYANINFPSSGSYLIEYRVASESGGGVISTDLNAGTTVLGTVNVPSTGGWQNWTTVSHTVNVNAGTYPLGIYAQTGGFNLNWIKITKTSGAAPANINAGAPVAAAALEASAVEVYPVPADDAVKVSFVGAAAKATIINTMGQKVLTIDALQSNEAINISNLKNGIYFITIETENGKAVKRIIKK